ncbi:hypothetical protein IMCC3317_04710 [Kordia antarctica]|uniref:Uncharacterized protein n=2 Tax=Kordia antarctica TaxID=1218801 RepID=A0A7L4ZET4_9FLAO|nr:hypothetical protein IMCC3317_04710 [Kordia antarctica]
MNYANFKDFLKLRRPKYYGVSNFLANNHFGISLAETALIILIYWALNEVIPFENKALKIIGPVLIAIIFAKYYFHVLLKTLKAFLSKGFNIVIFRRFTKSINLSNSILPIVGLYGKINLINDYTLVTTRIIGDETDTTEILSEISIHKHSNKNDWESTVIEFIKKSNIAIFYWAEAPTENMKWEMKEAIKLKDSIRILLILEDNIINDSDIQNAMIQLDKKSIIVFKLGNFTSQFYQFILN